MFFFIHINYIYIVYYDLINHNRLKPCVKLNTQNRIEAKNSDKDRKVFYKLKKNSAYDKTIKNLKNTINVKIVNNQTYYLLNNKFLRYSVNRIQSNYHKIGAYEINTSYLSYFDYQIYI